MGLLFADEGFIHESVDHRTYPCRFCGHGRAGGVGANRCAWLGAIGKFASRRPDDCACFGGGADEIHPS